MHKVNLNNNVRLDLVSDVDADCNISKKTIKGIRIEKTVINNKNYRVVNKSKGEYISLFFDDITDYDIRKSLIEVLSLELKTLLNKKQLLGKHSLIVGLGNDMSTPDSLGPKVLKNIITTRHISVLSSLDNNYSVVSKIEPGVFANTGIESFDIVKSIIRKIKPDFVIIIDSLCSTTLDKVNRVIQFTDSGIDPGSGVNNHRKGFSKNSLGVDVISIGVPTVVNLYSIVKDVSNDYLVTPKDIDFVIEELGVVISKSINNALHNLT